MQYSKADMFIDEAFSGEKTSPALGNNYNRNWESKAFLAVHANTTSTVEVELYTGATAEATNTLAASWTRAPNKDGYVVMDRLPRGLGQFMKLKVTTTGSTKVRAGIVLEDDLDYGWADRDPKATFNGIKTDAEVQAEIA